MPRVAAAKSTSRVLEAGPFHLNVSVRPGRGGEPPLLLLNGIGAALETFDPLISALPADRSVIRFDAPGIGGSPLPNRPYRFCTLARALSRVLDELGYDCVDVFGISWGGGLAQQFAFTERRRCRRLVLVATGTGALMVPAHPRVLLKMATPRRYRDPQYLAEVAPQIYGGSAREPSEELQALARRFHHGGQFNGYALQLLAGTGWTSVPFLPLLGQRTLVLTGDDDPIIPVANGRLLSRLIRHSELELYPGGHIELVAQPNLLAPRIEDFLTAA